MKFTIAGLQTGTYTKEDTYETYMQKQLELLRRTVAEVNPYLVVFPEMMTGPYFCLVMDEKWFESAEDFETGPTTTIMIEQAKTLNTHIVYSLFEKEISDGKVYYYNTLGIVSPTRGIIGKYRKTHIPYVEDRSISKVSEKFYFTKSNIAPQLFELDNGTKIGLLICYDRSFAELWRSYYLLGAEIICAATCAFGDRKEIFTPELKTRAFETHTFVIATNRSGSEEVEGEDKPRTHFGCTSIFDPVGKEIACAQSGQWCYAAQEFDSEVNEYANKRWHFKRDRRPEFYSFLVDNKYLKNFSGINK